VSKYLPSSGDVRLVEFQHLADDLGSLLVIEQGKHVAFPIKRVFHVQAVEGSTRGQHAHYQCAQVMICLSGSCRIVWTDGVDQLEQVMSHPNHGLFVPPGIWAEQNYQEAQSTLLVLCDHLYDEDDYIRNYDSFLAYRKESQQR